MAAPRFKSTTADVLVAATTLAVLLFSPKAIVDDAYISYRHAWNLVHGRGLVFNAGERVEGFSNLLWTLVSAIPIALHIPVDTVCSWLGAALAIAALVRARQWAERAGASRLASTAAALAVAFTPAYALNAINGLEAGLYALVLTETFGGAIAQATPWGVGLFGGLSFLTRPESLGFLPLCALALARRRRPASAIFQMAFSWLAIALAATAWRLAYYRHAFPNSVVAKAISPESLLTLRSDGIAYVAGFAREAPLLVVLALAAPLLAPREMASWVAVLAGLGTATLAMAVGGDWMPYHRLLIMYAPVLALGAAAGLTSLEGRLRDRPGWKAVVAVTLAAGAFVSAVPEVRHGAPSVALRKQSMDYQPLAEALSPVLARDDIIAPEAIGLIGYLLPDCYIHDFSGLTDEFIAYQGHGRTVFGRRNAWYTANRVHPTIYIFHSGVTWWPALFRRHLAGAEFNDAYESWEFDDDVDRGIVMCIRRDIADRVLPAFSRFSMHRVTIPPLVR